MNGVLRCGLCATLIICSTSYLSVSHKKLSKEIFNWMITIKFNIDYTTQWGENLCISGSSLQLGKFNQSHALVLSTNNGHNWTGEIHLPSIGDQSIEYYYFVCKNGVQVRKEEAPNRLLMINSEAEYIVNDYWKNSLSDSFLYTSAFTDAIFKHTLHPVSNLKII